MDAILFKSDSKEKTKLLLQLAKHLNIKTSRLSTEELEDLSLISSIDEGLESGFLAREDAIEFLRKLKGD